MLEIIELCRKYGISISFDLIDDSDVVIVRMFNPRTDRASKLMINCKGLDKVVDKKTYVDSTIGPIIHSFCHGK